MDSLVLQLRKNQSNLDKMRVRLQCVRAMASAYETDFSKQFGAYAEDWDEWYSWVLSDRAEFQADVHAIKQFTDDLRSYLIACSESTPSTTVLKDDTAPASTEMMQSLATEMLVCESDMLARMDEHISELREFVSCMRELEASDRQVD